MSGCVCICVFGLERENASKKRCLSQYVEHSRFLVTLKRQVFPVLILRTELSHIHLSFWICFPPQGPEGWIRQNYGGLECLPCGPLAPFSSQRTSLEEIPIAVPSLYTFTLILSLSLPLLTPPLPPNRFSKSIAKCSYSISSALSPCQLNLKMFFRFASISLVIKNGCGGIKNELKNKCTSLHHMVKDPLV